MEPKPPVLPIKDIQPVMPEFQTEAFIMEANGVIQQFDQTIEDARESHILNGNTSQFRDLLVDQVFNPISQDENVSRSALGFIAYSIQDPTLLKDWNDIREERAQQSNPSRSLPEVIMGITHGVNYIKVFYEGKQDYIHQDNLRSYRDWGGLYAGIANDPVERTIYKDTLRTKEIVTTDPRRAVGVHAVANMLFEGREINWLDSGPSTNWNLVRVSSKEAAAEDPYTMLDKTFYKGRKKIALNATRRLVNIGIGLGLDKVNVYNDRDWFLACDLPGNMNPQALEAKRTKMAQYKKIKNLQLISGQDMRNPQVETGKWDIFSALTSAYLVPNGDGQRDQMFRDWERFLTDDPHSIIAVQDYLHVNKNGGLDLVDSRKDGEYALAIKGKVTDGLWKVIFRYKDSHCSEIYNGENMEEFMDRISAENVSAYTNGKSSIL